MKIECSKNDPQICLNLNHISIKKNMYKYGGLLVKSIFKNLNRFHVRDNTYFGFNYPLSIATEVFFQQVANVLL